MSADAGGLRWGDVDAFTLQAILQWSLRQGGDGTQETASHLFEAMDPERRRWLQQAFESLTVDIVEEMQKHIAILKEPDTDEESREKKCTALEALQEMIEDMDNARDLYVIGGLQPVVDMLKHGSSEVRWRAAELVGTVVQNNPVCQQFALELNLLPIIVAMLQDDDVKVRTKAVRTVSCLVRENSSLVQGLLALDGVEKLVALLQAPAALCARVLFLLSYLCRLPSVGPVLEKTNTLERLGTLLDEAGDAAVWEQGLQFLRNMLEVQPAAAATLAQQHAKVLRKHQQELQQLSAEDQDARREEGEHLAAVLAAVKL
eukprot:m.135714 g.135714  ORF g.135714 m.135714 type:complete len:317 (+) comp20172_c1_seq2:744-1694(+)